MSFKGFNTFRTNTVGLGLVDCGEKTGYQVQSMSSLNTRVHLLNEAPDPDVAPDPALAALAQQVNQFFEPKALQALQAKRAQLAAAGRPDLAQRCEITVLLTDHGLQLGWARALEWKELAPAPRKSLLRRSLGPLYPGRKYWRMPPDDATPPQTRTVWWPWIFWAALAALLAFVSWSTANGMLFDWTHTESGAWGLG